MKIRLAETKIENLTNPSDKVEYYDAHYIKDGKEMVYAIMGKRNEVLDWADGFLMKNKLDKIELHNLDRTIVVDKDGSRILESVLDEAKADEIIL